MTGRLGLIGAFELTAVTVFGQIATSSGTAVAFGPGEIAVVVALLAATTGALTLTFRLLLASKDAQIAEASRRIAGLEMLLSQASVRAETQELRLTDLLTGSVRASEVASVAASAALREMAGMIREQQEQSSQEHRGIVDALERLAPERRHLDDHPAAANRRPEDRP